MGASESSVVESSLEGEWVGSAKDLAGLHRPPLRGLDPPRREASRRPPCAQSPGSRNEDFVSSGIFHFHGDELVELAEQPAPDLPEPASRE